MKYKNITMLGDNDTCRFLLEISGDNPIIMIGANPSTANESKPDKTVTNALGIAERNGFDGLILLNIYAQRATYPSGLHQECDLNLHKRNMDVVKSILKRVEHPKVLLCYGNVIIKRKYLKSCLKDILSLFPSDTSWRKMDELTVLGNPRHLSRLSLKAQMTNAEDYINNLIH